MSATAALGLALSVGLALAPAAQPEVSLKWNLKEGDVFYAKSVQVMDMTMTVMGNPIDQKQEATNVVRFRVKAVRPTQTVVEMTTVDFKLGAAGIPGAGALVEKMRGLTFTATLDDKMNVTKLEGYDKFIDAISGGDPTQKKLMEAMIPEATFAQMVSQTFAMTPDKPVRPGDTWVRSDKLSMGPLGNFMLKQKFKLDGVTGDVAKVGVNVDMSFRPADGGGAGGLPFKITKADMKAEDYSGTYTFDTKAGRLTEAVTKGTMVGSMTASAGGQELEIGMKMKINQTVIITDKNPVKD